MIYTVAVLLGERVVVSATYPDVDSAASTVDRLARIYAAIHPTARVIVLPAVM